MIVNDDEFLVMCPIESHVTKILKDIMIWVSHDMNIAMSRSTLWAKCPQCMFCMGRIASQCLLNLFVDDNVNLYAALGGPLDDFVEPPFLVEKWRTAQEQLRGQPPVLDVDGLFGRLESYRDGPHVVTAIHIPFDVVAVALGEE